MMKHACSQNILYHLQHLFRSRLFCETQLVQFIDYLVTQCSIFAIFYQNTNNQPECEIDEDFPSSGREESIGDIHVSGQLLSAQKRDATVDG